MTEGFIFDIKRFAVHDGPGIRTTVFFKGCPLVCRWCHNPESRASEPETSVRHLALDGKVFEKEEITGYITTVKEVIEQVGRDRVFYDESNGGVTLSGGEPLYQPLFCRDLLHALYDMGIHTALDTTGYAPAHVLQEMLPYTNLFLYDLKIIREEAHIRYTGVSNKQILENLKFLFLSGKQVIIRFPVIPGINDTAENLSAMTAFLTPFISLEPVSPVEIHLLPYHSYAATKYRRFRLDIPMDLNIPPGKNQLRSLKDRLEQEGFVVKTGG